MESNSKPITAEQKSNREFKDTFFRTLFHEEDRALELCNAVEGTNFPKGTPLKFYTFGDNSLTRRNNDFAVVVNDQLLTFQDHQSTINPNMPLRLLPSAAEILYTWLVDKKSLYKNKLVTIPTPKFYVLYNGTDKLIKNELRLSDAFRFIDKKYSMELTVKVIDIKYSKNNEVLQKSPSLNGYAYLIAKIKSRTEKGIPRDKAISMAVNDCIRKGILADFLIENYKEVCDMFSWECTLEEEMEIKQEEAFEDGFEEGCEVGREEGHKEGHKEGVLESAKKLIKKGMLFQDVVDLLDLSDFQTEELKRAII